MKICSVSGCDRPIKRKGLCNCHYLRQWRHGDAAAGRIAKGGCTAWLGSHKDYEGRDCLIWPYARNSKGYARMQAAGHSRMAHRYMCGLAHGQAPSPDHEAAHTCGNGHLGCVNPNHLTWKTPSANQMDRVEHGTSNRGARHGMSKLSEDEAREVKRLASIGRLSQEAIARAFGVSRATVSDIANGRRWAWLEVEPC